MIKKDLTNRMRYFAKGTVFATAVFTSLLVFTNWKVFPEKAQHQNPGELIATNIPPENNYLSTTENLFSMNQPEKPVSEKGARISPLPVSDMQDSWVKTLERLPGAALKGRFSPVNVFGTLMHSPRTMGSFLDYWVTSKLEMDLTPREQELIILRMGYLFNCNYVWKHHFPLAKEYGANDAELQAVKTSPLPEVFSPREYALLMLTDEMVEHRTVRDEAWSKWSGELKESEMIDLISIVSQYVFFSLFNNSLQIEIESPLSEVPGL